MTELNIDCTSCGRALHDGELVQLDLAGGMACTDCVRGGMAHEAVTAARRPEARDDGR